MKQQINDIISQLRGYYPEEELRELAFWIVEEATGLTRTQILTACKGTQNIPNIEIILQKLRAHEPIQYILGYSDFCGLRFKVTPATLIPRPETSELVEWVANEATGSESILDIGTGSGCIAVSLASKLPKSSVSAWDISAEALAVATENSKANSCHKACKTCSSA